MIQFLQHDLIDKAKWDNSIERSINGNLYARSWYLDIVSPSWCALLEGDYENVMPLTTSAKIGIKYIMQPYFTQQLGLFFGSMLSEDCLVRFLEAIPTSFKYIDINLNSSNQVHNGYDVSEMTNLELDMSQDYKVLFSNYQTNLQRNLKKAAQNGLRLAKGVKPQDIISLFRQNKGKELGHLGNEQYALIGRIADALISRNMGETWGAYSNQGELIAGILWAKSFQKGIFLFSALSNQGKNMNAMPWLIDLFIQEHAGKTMILDFEGSNDEGLARFYASFGSRRVIYYRYRRNTLPAFIKHSLNLWRKSRTTAKKYLNI